MNTSKHRVPTLHPADLEETAELPVLPDGVTGIGDSDNTHVMPALDALAHTDTWQVGIASIPTVPPVDGRVLLEDKLRALTGSLRELEDRLQSKSEQLSVFEREVGARDRRISWLETQLADLGGQLSAARSHADARSTELDRLQLEFAALGASHHEHSEVRQRLEREYQTREAALTHAQQQALDAVRRSERYGEVLHTLEGRRYLFDTMLGERDQQLATAQARTAELELQLLARDQQATLRESHLQSDVEGRRSHAEQLQQLLAEAQARLAALETQLRSERESGEGKLAAQQERGRQLEAQVAEHLETGRTLQEQLQQARTRIEVRTADLAVAEERIRSLENDVRQRELRLERQAEAEAVLREQLTLIEHSLQERNALIGRLEGEAASSAAVLGSIQQNLERLGNESEAPPAAARSRPAPVGEILRLLVRTEGAGGIVHVLGRRTTIGRTPDNDLQIDADFISRHHAVVLITAAGTVIEDLDSTNGVYVNGARVSRITLAEGDVVTIGRTTFRYVHRPASER